MNIELADLRELPSSWKKDPQYVYIGRPSVWGNPYSVKEYGRDTAIRKYREWIAEKPQLIERAKRELRGKVLVCFCAPRYRCHGEVLKEIVEG